jgi:hypothetical protein
VLKPIARKLPTKPEIQIGTAQAGVIARANWVLGALHHDHSLARA